MWSSPLLRVHDGEAGKLQFVLLFDRAVVLHPLYADMRMGALRQPISLGRPFCRGAMMVNSAREHADHALSAGVRL